MLLYMNNNYSRDVCNNIITSHGCKCKSEFNEDMENNSGKIIKNSCTTYDSNSPWCETNDDCGFNINNKWYDYCEKQEDTVFNHKGYYSKLYIYKNTLGILIFIVLFVIIVPYLIIYAKIPYLLDVYMPNFDILATTIAYNNGPYNIFQDLYNQNSTSVIGYINYILISLLSLSGIVYLVARKTRLTGNVIHGWGAGVIMVLFTYLLPNDIISFIQKHSTDYINITSPSYKYPFAVLIGLCMAALFITIERFLITKQQYLIDPIARLIYSFGLYRERKLTHTRN